MITTHRTGLYVPFCQLLKLAFSLIISIAAGTISEDSTNTRELEFATILFLYNRGINSPLNFSTCTTNMDPTIDANCPSSQGVGNYAQEIKSILVLL